MEVMSESTMGDMARVRVPYAMSQMDSQESTALAEMPRDGVLPSIGVQELEALESLDQSIRFHEIEDEQDIVSPIGSGDITIIPTSFQPFKLAAIPETRESKTELSNEPNTSQNTDANRKINAGYILFDGSEIKYVSHSTKAGTDSVRTSGSGSDKTSSIRSRSSTVTQASEIPVNISMSLDELLGYEYLKRCSITPYKRLPTTAHFSFSEKMYFFLLGLASTVTFNAIFMSVAFFMPLLGIQVLSILGSCHFISALLAMLVVFCCKRHWFPFLPSVSVSLVLMAGVVAAFPVLAALDVRVPVYAIYGLVCLNGVCVGMAQAVIEKMVLLFPGGKSSLLVRWGQGIGCVFPALLQAILILIKYKVESELRLTLTSYNTFCLYIVLPVACLATLLGLVSVVKLRRCGIYRIFADMENATFSPQYTTISSSPTLSKNRCRKIAAFMVAVTLVSAVSYYSLSLAPYVHSKTLASDGSNQAPFWKMYLTTIFLGLYRLGDFCGSMLGTLSICCCKPLPKVLRSVLCLGLAVMRVGLVPLLVLFIWGPFLLYYNIFAMGFYFVLALSNGFLTFCIATQCQMVCVIKRRDVCPIVAQLTWLCIHLGSVVGVALSFVPLS